jgi:hypothetical protein
MEADWAVEIGPQAAVVDAEWEGAIDLRREPWRVVEISEAQQLPALAEALVLLNRAPNAGETRLRTSKSDLWTVEDNIPLDPDEMDARPGETASAVACYIDLLPSEARVFSSLPETESWIRSAVLALRARPNRCSRTDLTLRQAVARTCEGYGITAYLTGCGADADAAKQALSSAIRIFADIVSGIPAPQETAEPLQ